MTRTDHPLRCDRGIPYSKDRLPRNKSRPTGQSQMAFWPEPEVGQGAFARSPEMAQLEAVLMIADEPLTLRKMAAILNCQDSGAIRQLLAQLQELYDQEGSSFHIEELAGGFQLLTREDYHPWLVRFHGTGGDLKLTPTARETLAIVAYRQPITRADIEVIRGVSCSDVLRQLMEKKLIRITGRDDTLGRPVLYGTTKKFLQAMGLRTIRDLPRWAELKGS